MKLFRKRERAKVIDIRTGEEVAPPKTLLEKLDEIETKLDEYLAWRDQRNGRS